MRQKSYAGPLLMIFAGLGLFGSVAGSGSLQAYRTLDIFSLVLVGVCFGYGAASIACLRRRKESNP